MGRDHVKNVLDNMVACKEDYDMVVGFDLISGEEDWYATDPFLDLILAA